RGFGWWLWKPNIILDALRDYERVIYLDATIEIIKSPEELFKSDINLFSNGQLHLRYCKKYCLNRMGLLSGDVDDLQPQVNAAIQLYQKTDRSISFLTAWARWCTNLKVINDDIGKEKKYFIAHRHDQSILTNLAILNKIYLPESPCQYGLQ